jgi:hypothetical protein
MNNYVSSFVWEKAYRCTCGKIMLEQEVGYQGLVYPGVHDVCPLCGEFRRNFTPGAVRIKYYFVREYLFWGLFPYMQKKRNFSEFKPYPIEQDIP